MRNRRELAVDINVINYVPTYDGISKSVKADYVSEGALLTIIKIAYHHLMKISILKQLNEALDKVVFAKNQKTSINRCKSCIIRLQNQTNRMINCPYG